MIRPYPPPWAKRPDTLVFRCSLPHWWLMLFTLPILYRQGLPWRYNQALLLFSGLLTLYFLYRAFASIGAIQLGKAGIAWKLGFKRGWLPWDEIVEIEETGKWESVLVVSHSGGHLRLPVQGIKETSRLKMELLRRASIKRHHGSRLTFARSLESDVLIGFLLGLPVTLARGPLSISDMILYGLAASVIILIVGTNQCSSGSMLAAITDSNGITWRPSIFKRSRRICWSDVVASRLVYSENEEQGILMLITKTDSIAVPGSTPGLLEILRMSDRSTSKLEKGGVQEGVMIKDG